METIWPTDKGFEGLFLVGFRKALSDPVKTERVGYAILKRTYDIDFVSKELKPSENPLPIFMRDEPENRVMNGDFGVTEKDLTNTGSSLHPAFWESRNMNAQRVRTPGESDDASDDQNYTVSLQGSDPNGEFTQTVVFKESVAGRTFTLSLYLWTDFPSAHVDNIHLLAEGATPICVINGLIGNTPQRLLATGMFPPDLNAKEVKIVLRLSRRTDTGALTPTYYNRVQLEERPYATRWDSSFVLKVENDLVPYKPEGDVIVSGYSTDASLCSLAINGAVWLRRTNTRVSDKSLFGWEPRADSAHPERRKELAGAFSSDPNDYPPEWPVTDPRKDPLPGGTEPFDNRFFNGYLRVARVPGSLTYIPSGANVAIVRNGAMDFSAGLPDESLTARYYVDTGSGSDPETMWASTRVDMNMDTLVLEPEINRCYAIWRGVWNFDDYEESRYRRLEVMSG